MRFLIMSLICLSSTQTWGVAASSRSRVKKKSGVQSVAQKAPTNSDQVLCDAQKEITPKLLARKLDHDSEKFYRSYTGIYQSSETSIRRICEFLKRCEFNSNKENDQEIRSLYQATASGKLGLAQLDLVRTEFKYNSVDYYLFDDHELNDLKNDKSTHMVKKGDRTYYLNDQKLIGFFDQVGEEGILTRFDQKCEVSELVSFSSVTSLDNPIRLKVTKKYCTSAQNKGPTFKHTDEMLRDMGAYFSNPDRVEDQMEAQQLCEHWVPKAEPFGLVIDAGQPVGKTAIERARDKKKISGSNSKKSVRPVPARQKKKTGAGSTQQ